MPYTISTYKGTINGWQPIAIRSDLASAKRFCSLLRRVRPSYLHKISRLSRPSRPSRPLRLWLQPSDWSYIRHSLGVMAAAYGIMVAGCFAVGAVTSGASTVQTETYWECRRNYSAAFCLKAD